VAFADGSAVFRQIHHDPSYSGLLPVTSCLRDSPSMANARWDHSFSDVDQMKQACQHVRSPLLALTRVIFGRATEMFHFTLGSLSLPSIEGVFIRDPRTLRSMGFAQCRTPDLPHA